MNDLSPEPSLARPDALEDVVEACFRETVTVEGAALRVKRVARPGGATGKAAEHTTRG